MSSGSINDLVELLKIKLALNGLNILPSNASKNSINVHILEVLPAGLHIFWRTEGGVLELGSSDEERLAIDNQLLGDGSLFQVDRCMRHLDCCYFGVSLMIKVNRACFTINLRSRVVFYNLKYGVKDPLSSVARCTRP